MVCVTEYSKDKIDKIENSKTEFTGLEVRDYVFSYKLMDKIDERVGF